MVYLNKAETVDLNPNVMCTSKSEVKLSTDWRRWRWACSKGQCWEEAVSSEKKEEFYKTYLKVLESAKMQSL